MLKHTDLELSENPAKGKQIECVASIPAATGVTTEIKIQAETKGWTPTISEESRRIWKIVLVANLTWILFTCAFWQLYALLTNHPEVIQWLTDYISLLMTLTLIIISLLTVAYCCYLLARNLTDFILGQGVRSQRVNLQQ